jgi:polysaccharide biosynthesis protein PslG
MSDHFTGGSFRVQAVAALCLFALLFSACASNAQPARSWPASPAAPAFPQSLGVNIHFTEPQPGELKALAAAGFRWVRMDFVWQSTEVEKGKYDFSSYDRLLKALDEYQIRPLFILDYANTLYDSGRAPSSSEGRRAFASWAAAAVARYRGRGILWEIYNEPNTGFWTPEPRVADYVKLALETSKAIRAVAPNEQIIGPAVWGFDFNFMEECLRAGLLDYWAAVSVHPYRKSEPETVVDDYNRLRHLIDKYAPAGKHVPIISSEWGYSDASFNIGEAKQSALLARQLLINQSQGIALSIWYDWQDDGREASQIEHHFGTVRHANDKATVPLFVPKPAYRAAETLASVMNGCRFSERISTPELRSDDYVLAFNCNGETRLAAWTTSWFDRAVVVPFAAGTYRIVKHSGETVAGKPTRNAKLELLLTNAPQYILPASQ